MPATVSMVARNRPVHMIFAALQKGQQRLPVLCLVKRLQIIVMINFEKKIRKIFRHHVQYVIDNYTLYEIDSRYVTREALIKSLSDFILGFLCNA